MSHSALVIGGGNGIGLAIGIRLQEKGYKKIYVLDYKEPSAYPENENMVFVRFNLLTDDYSVLEQFSGIDTLVITAGIGRIAPFEELTSMEITNGFKVNAISACCIIQHFYDRLTRHDDFYCCVMGSIAGWVSSPLFSVYGATKAAICKFIESINIEIEKKGSANRILNVSPGMVEGTGFYGGNNQPYRLMELADMIIDKMLAKECLFIPHYTETYKEIISRYHNNSYQFGMESYDYKNRSDRKRTKPQIITGYLSGTFDLFHIGHLNLLRRAKSYCDYLVVGIHRDALHKGKEAFIPFEERLEIVQEIKFVDKVVEAYKEDTDAYREIEYDYLFVGSDYKGTERFNRYEEYFKDKSVKIIYFPYTQRTNSTQLRNLIASSITN